MTKAGRMRLLPYLYRRLLAGDGVTFIRPNLGRTLHMFPGSTAARHDLNLLVYKHFRLLPQEFRFFVNPADTSQVRIQSIQPRSTIETTGRGERGLRVVVAVVGLILPRDDRERYVAEWQQYVADQPTYRLKLLYVLATARTCVTVSYELRTRQQVIE